MSDTVLVAIITGASTAVVGVAGIVFGFWNSSRERDQRLQYLKLEQDEQYRVGLYEKRLVVHQEAYKWLMDLIDPLREAMKEDATDESLFKDTLRQRGRDARSWWDANCLYLDERSRSRVVDFIEICKAVGWKEWTPEDIDPIRTYLDALRVVQEGIGMKHLDNQQVTRAK